VSHGIALRVSPERPRLEQTATAEAPFVRRLLIAGALGFLALFIVLPVAVVFLSAASLGAEAYLQALREPVMLSAVRLTLLTAGIAVPLNLLFGLAAAWLIANYRFAGKGLLISLIDLPFSVSPVVSGLVYVLLFGRTGWFGPLLEDLGFKVIYAVPGIVLATIFVTFPIVAREVLQVMLAQGNTEEQAALTLGASGVRVFFRITLPKVKWGVLYGVILCNARAMGEFGAVSVVSGHIRGETNTLPLHIEILYGEYETQAAFAAASLLALLALITLALKHWVEWQTSRVARRTNAGPATTSSWSPQEALP
jgi:sulfate transport system permease protein